MSIREMPSLRGVITLTKKGNSLSLKTRLFFLDELRVGFHLILISSIESR